MGVIKRGMEQKRKTRGRGLAEGGLMGRGKEQKIGDRMEKIGGVKKKAG